MKTENEDYDENTGLGIYGNGTDKPDAPSEPTAATKATHTPGPWQFEAPYIHADSLKFLAVVSDRHSQDRPELVANARLIAAAPELLAALGNLLSFCEKAHYDCTVLSEARAAIAKATGTTP